MTVCLFVCQQDYANTTGSIFLNIKAEDGFWSNIDTIKC